MAGSNSTGRLQHQTAGILSQADEEERDSIHATDHDAEDRRLAAAAAFTDGQRAALCGLRRRLLLNLGRLQRRREALTAQLQVKLET
jgi:hypothetical protein